MIRDVRGQRQPNEICPECGSSRLVESLRDQKFMYGQPGCDVELTASMPVFACEDCGFEYFDERGEAARHAAICRHEGVQTPEEMRRGREESGLSRVELSVLSKVGIASIQRWESGSVVPNQSCDRLMYLLRFRSNVELLQQYEGWLLSRAGAQTALESVTPEEPQRACAVRCSRTYPRLKNRARSEAQAAQWSLRSR